MPQTTAGMSGKDVKIEFSTNGTTWTDISGYANKVEPDDAERKTGEANTFDGDVPIVKGGKRGGLKVKISVVYTEDVSGAWNTIKAQFDSGGDAYVRYAPRGGQAGEKQFTSDAGIISKVTYPKTDAGSGEVVMAGFELHTPKLNEGNAA